MSIRFQRGWVEGRLPVFTAARLQSRGGPDLASEDGDVVVVKAGPTFDALATNVMSEVIMATSAVSGGVIFIRTLGHLVSVG